MDKDADIEAVYVCVCVACSPAPCMPGSCLPVCHQPIRDICQGVFLFKWELHRGRGLGRGEGVPRRITG